MRIESIRTNNFKALAGEREFLDLPDGIIGVVGDNGKGKSTLLSAVAYALYGGDVLDTGLADVVTWGEERGWAEVALQLNGHDYKVKRGVYKGASQGTVTRDDNETISSGASTITVEVEKLLGIDRVGFLASVFSKQNDLLGIGSLQPAKRQSTILRLLQFDRIDAALKNLSESNRDLNKEVGMLRQFAKPVIGVDPKVIAEYEGHQSRLRTEIEGYETTLDLLAGHVRKAESKIESYNIYAGKANKLQGELNAARESMTRAFKEAEAELPPMPVAPKVIIDPAKYEFQQEDAKRAEQNAKKSVCPTCNRPFDSDGAKAAAAYLADAKEWLAEHAQEYKDIVAYNNACASYERAVEAQRAAQVRAENAQSLVMDKMDALDGLVPVENPTSEWNRANTAYNDAKDKLNKAKRDLVQVETSLQHMRTALADQEERQRQWAEHEAEIKRLEHEILVNGQTEMLMKRYKNALIASVIPTITERASSLIGEMTEGKYTELHLTPQYDIEYKPADQEELKSFANLSGGEKDVFALALRLAIADLKAGSIGVLVLDEVLDSLDAGRQEATWAALEKLTNRYNQIFVITHVDSFKDRAPYTIQV